MEIAEAEQWVQDHHQWKPSKLMDEVKKQKWDPSVQGLVAFQPVLVRLSQDMGWTTALGNAFLAQQPDVMHAVQDMRKQAQARGTLKSTPQETVTTTDQGGQSAIDIEPANPDVWYAPDYNPAYVWGPPVYESIHLFFIPASTSVSIGARVLISDCTSAAGEGGDGVDGAGPRIGTAAESI